MADLKPKGQTTPTTIGDSFIHLSNNEDSYQYSLNKQEFYTTVKQLDDEVDRKFAEMKVNIDKRDKYNALKFRVFGLSGVLGSFIWGLIYAEMNTFDQIFSHKSFSFYVFIPAYVQIPISLLVNKFLSCFKPGYACKVYFSVVLYILCLSLIPLVLRQTKNTYSCKNQVNRS